jgi:hypothetical protein
MAKIGVDAAYPLNGEYLLMTDNIELTNWTPIGGAQPFTGTFDGGGHTITLSGFNPAALSESFTSSFEGQTLAVRPAGMFRHTRGAVIKNFTLNISGSPAINFSVISGLSADWYSYCAGGVAGFAENTTFEDIDITGGTLTVSASDNVHSSKGLQAGGLTGEATGSFSIIRNCTSAASVTAAGTGSGLLVGAGGISGNVADGLLTRCAATGAVSATAAEGKCHAGGLVGGSNTGHITNSYATGAVHAESSLPGPKPETVAGGLAGELGDDAEAARISNCYATGSVSATVGGSGGLILAGGLAGSQPDDKSAIENCYATGTVSASGTSANVDIGGLSGGSWDSGNSIQNSVALNGSLTSSVSSPTSTAIHRIIATTGATLTNNYGLTDMNGVTWTSNAAGPDGANVSTADETWWKTTAGWNAKFGNSESAPWVWDSVKNRPKLWWE